MVGGRAIGVHLHARCSCDGQAQRRTALAVAMRVSDRGSGRSGAIDEAADIAIPDQPSVTVTSQLFTQNEPTTYQCGYHYRRSAGVGHPQSNTFVKRVLV